LGQELLNKIIHHLEKGEENVRYEIVWMGTYEMNQPNYRNAFRQLLNEINQTAITVQLTQMTEDINAALGKGANKDDSEVAFYWKREDDGGFKICWDNLPSVDDTQNDVFENLRPLLQPGGDDGDSDEDDDGDENDDGYIVDDSYSDDDSDDDSDNFAAAPKGQHPATPQDKGQYSFGMQNTNLGDIYDISSEEEEYQKKSGAELSNTSNLLSGSSVVGQDEGPAAPQGEHLAAPQNEGPPLVGVEVLAAAQAVPAVAQVVPAAAQVVPAAAQVVPAAAQVGRLHCPQNCDRGRRNKGYASQSKLDAHVSRYH
jgi:hypothetical protein